MFKQLLDTEDLSLFLQQNGDLLFDLCNATYDILQNDKSNIEYFIMLQPEKVEALDFSISRNKAFLHFIFDLSERLQLQDCIQQTHNWLLKYDIVVGSRLQAALLFNIEISDNEIYIARFNSICELLEKALLEEDDNDKKVLATFANYYLAVLDRHYIWIQRLREVIRASFNQYSFLRKPFISELIAYDVIDTELCAKEILQLKDELFDRHPIVIQDNFRYNNFLIEEDTDYARLLLSSSNISFEWIRSIAFNNVGFGAHLENRGVEPLTNEQDLFVYLKSYGNMHYAKMQSAIEKLPIDQINGTVEIIDWGCGQALATIAFMDYLQIKGIKIRPNIILIEPSETTIKRAALHVKSFFPDSQIKTVCKYFDDVLCEDVFTYPEATKIHLFSNIIDVELFSISKLECLISGSQKGENYFICVSPYIDDFKTDRVDGFRQYFQNNYDKHYNFLGKETNSKSDNKYWNCNNNFKNKRCYNHPEVSGCFNKWTRVIRVFKVEL